MFHFVFMTKNIITGRRYIGVHSSLNLSDGYLGDNSRLLREIEKIGIQSFNREILYFAVSASELYELVIKVIAELAKIEGEEFYSIAVAHKTDRVLRGKRQWNQLTNALYIQKRKKLLKDRKIQMPMGNRGNHEFKHSDDTKARISRSMKSKCRDNPRVWYHNPANPRGRKLLISTVEIPIGWIRGKGPTLI